MKTKASATAMSMEYLRERGYIVERTEQTVRALDKKLNKWKIWKKDLWSFADLAAVDTGKANILGTLSGTLYVQCTIGMNNKGARMDKIQQAAATRAILASGNYIELHVWRKVGPRKTWELAQWSIRIRGDSFVWEDATGEVVQGGPLFSKQSLVEEPF